MGEKEVKNAILYIIKKSQEERFPIGKTRLIKLLYLLDVEYYRNYKKTYTGLDWKYYKFGPYAFEVDKICESIGITEEEKNLKNNKIFKKT